MESQAPSQHAHVQPPQQSHYSQSLSQSFDLDQSYRENPYYKKAREQLSSTQKQVLNADLQVGRSMQD
jgi:hypothetical protein